MPSFWSIRYILYNTLHIFFESKQFFINCHSGLYSPVDHWTAMASNSYLDPSRRYLSPLVTHGRSPSSSSSARTMYSSTTSSSRTSSGYHQPSSGSQQASTGTHVGYSRNGGYNNPPEVQRYRDPGNGNPACIIGSSDIDNNELNRCEIHDYQDTQFWWRENCRGDPPIWSPTSLRALRTTFLTSNFLRYSEREKRSQLRLWWIIFA